jgi:hypothetical protein
MKKENHPIITTTNIKTSQEGGPGEAGDVFVIKGTFFIAL